RLVAPPSQMEWEFGLATLHTGIFIDQWRMPAPDAVFPFIGRDFIRQKKTRCFYRCQMDISKTLIAPYWPIPRLPARPVMPPMVNHRTHFHTHTAIQVPRYLENKLRAVIPEIVLASQHSTAINRVQVDPVKGA